MSRDGFDYYDNEEDSFYLSFYTDESETADELQNILSDNGSDLSDLGSDISEFSDFWDEDEEDLDEYDEFNSDLVLSDSAVEGGSGSNETEFSQQQPAKSSKQFRNPAHNRKVVWGKV